MSDMINPIVIDIDKNVCPFCGGELVLVQHESSLIYLDEKGAPDDSDILKFETKGVCRKCYKEIDVDKEGMYYRVHCAYLDAKKELAKEKAYANPFFTNKSIITEK